MPGWPERHGSVRPHFILSRVIGYNYAKDIPRGKNMLSEHDFDEIDRSVDSLENRIRQLEAENAGLKDQIRSLKDENDTMRPASTTGTAALRR